MKKNICKRTDFARPKKKKLKTVKEEENVFGL